jgi:hypothetical protein
MGHCAPRMVQRAPRMVQRAPRMGHLKHHLATPPNAAAPPNAEPAGPRMSGAAENGNDAA